MHTSGCAGDPDRPAHHRRGARAARSRPVGATGPGRRTSGDDCVHRGRLVAQPAVASGPAELRREPSWVQRLRLRSDAGRAGSGGCRRQPRGVPPGDAHRTRRGGLFDDAEVRRSRRGRRRHRRRRVRSMLHGQQPHRRPRPRRHRSDRRRPRRAWPRTVRDGQDPSGDRTVRLRRRRCAHRPSLLHATTGCRYRTPSSGGRHSSSPTASSPIPSERESGAPRW